MTLVTLVVVVGVLGYVVAFPFVVRGDADLSRIPRQIWRITGYTSKRSWKLAIRGGYLLGGWPGLLAVLAWRRSEARQVLRDEWHILIEERRARREIILANYEDEPNDIKPAP